MLREKMQESDIDKKKIIENFEIEKCQLLSKARELERNSNQTKQVFQAAEEHLQNKIIVLIEKQTELEILLHEKHAKLQEKDAIIEKLHDRLLTVKEDILGGQWSAVKGEQPKTESCSKTSGFQHQSNLHHNTKSSASKDTVIQEKEVSFAQNPTLKQNPLEGLVKRTATLADPEEYIEQYEDLTDSIVICHVGTNDLRQSPDVVYSAVDKYVEIIENLKRLGARIIISSLLPWKMEIDIANLMTLIFMKINSDIICLLETKADKEHNMCLKGYTLLKKVARSRKGKAIHGGIALYARPNKRNSKWIVDYCIVSNNMLKNVCFFTVNDFTVHYDHCPINVCLSLNYSKVQQKVGRPIPKGLQWNNAVQKCYADMMVSKEVESNVQLFLGKDRVLQRNGVDEATEDLTDIFHNILNKIRSRNLPKGNRFKSKKRKRKKSSLGFDGVCKSMYRTLIQSSRSLSKGSVNEEKLKNYYGIKKQFKKLVRKKNTTV
ncbi:unnamed protein product [Mytilus coruscus]|uniref:Uncharacterized protein n=1 Tax=Mytilus coruscus TaxID=42192 RepID=A0A6J8CCU3_MYTCO|nr:unnamed protein product [Mytilus coruscus]